MGSGTTLGLIRGLAKPADPEVIAAEVDAWLEDNPEATTTVEDGAISYAKLNSDLKGSVDDVGSLKSAINAIGLYYDDIVEGSISSSDGTDSSSDKRARTNGYISLDDFWFCNMRGDSTYDLMIFLYKQDKTYIGRVDSSWLKIDVNRAIVNKEIYPTAAYLRIAFRRSDSGTITATDIANLKSYICASSCSLAQISRELQRESDASNDSLTVIRKGLDSQFFTNLEFGEVRYNGTELETEYKVRTGYIDINDFICCEIGSDYKMRCCVYDGTYTFIATIPQAAIGKSINQAIIKSLYPSTRYIRLSFERADGQKCTANNISVLRTNIFVNADASKLKEDKARFDNQFNYIAYSHLAANDAPYNTEEHFLKCAKMGGFTALKGDVRPTEDGGLIMCHDAGYTLDGNGKITTYDAEDNTPILTLTVAECEALTFAEQYEGKDCHPIDFETFVRICKKYGLICYVTVRDEAISTTVAPEVIRILKLYRMLDRSIINSFTKASLETFRGLDSSIMLSLVIDHNTAPTTSDVDYVYSLGNCILNMFSMPIPSSADTRPYEQQLDDLLSTSAYADVLSYAYTKNVIVYEAQSGTACIDVLLKHGITGLHMTAQPDYDYHRS